MSKSTPYVPIFFGDFLASTVEWKGEARSLYLSLLCHQWSIGSLPADPKSLAELVRWDHRSFAKHWPQVSQKFVPAPPTQDVRETCTGRAQDVHRLSNSRLEKHREKAQAFQRERAQSGRKGGNSRWHPHSSATSSATKELCAPILSHPIKRESIASRSAFNNKISATLIPAAVGNSHSLEGQEFNEIKATYPTFSGRQDWLSAQHHCTVLIERGTATGSQLIDGVKRYAKYCAAANVSTQYVMSPVKFFSAADQPWSQEWHVEAKKTKFARGMEAMNRAQS